MSLTATRSNFWIARLPKLWRRSWLCRRRHKHDLRHTFGTHCASAGVPLRTLQEWLGHRDFTTTLIYADYAPNPHEAELVELAFRIPEPQRVESKVRP